MNGETKEKQELSEEEIRQLIYFGRTTDGRIVLDLKNNKRIDWAFRQMIDYLSTRTLFNSDEIERAIFERINAIHHLK